MPTFAPSLELMEPLPAPIMLKPKVDLECDDGKEVEEDPMDIEGDVSNHKDEADEAEVEAEAEAEAGQVEDAARGGIAS